MKKARGYKRGDDWKRSMAAFAATLPACPQSSYNTSGSNKGGCYTGQIIDPAKFVPGAFSVLGAGFHISEVKEGFFEKTYRPSIDDRFWVDYAIIEGSVRYTATFYTIAGRGFSLEQLLTKYPKVKISLGNGFSLNPIAPTTSELTQANGVGRWLDRGGYFLYEPIALGALSPYKQSRAFSICGSILCNCSVQGGQPSCIQVAVGKSGVTSNPDEDEGWWVYVKLNTDGTVTVKLDFDDPSAWEKTFEGIAGFLKKLGEIFCGSAPMVQQQVSNAVAEKCTTKDYKPCTKGSADCTCIAPPTSAQVSAGASNAFMSYVCSKWQQGNQPPPVWEPPVAPVVPAQFKVPWWLVVGGGIAVGALLFSRR